MRHFYSFVDVKQVKFKNNPRNQTPTGLSESGPQNSDSTPLTVAQGPIDADIFFFRCSEIYINLTVLYSIW